MSPQSSFRLRAIGARGLATLASAAAIVLAFPPLQIRSLAWVGLVPLLLALRSSGKAEAALWAGVWGMLGAWGVTHWLPSALSRYYEQPLWLGTSLFLGASFVMGAVEYMAFALFYRWASRRRIALFPLVVAAAWVAAELGRTHLFTGNPWGLLGYTQGAMPQETESFGLRAGVAPLHLIQVADLAGVYGIGFVLAAANAALADACVAASRRSYDARTVAGIVSAAIVVASSFAYGAVRIAQQQRTDARASLTVAIVQADLDVGHQWRPELDGANLDEYLELTKDALAVASPAVVFWPENAMTFFLADRFELQQKIATVTMPAAVELVAGGPRQTAPSSPRFYNSAFLLAPDGRIAAHYDKQHLLPFAEYYPLSGAGVVKRSFAGVLEFSAGRDVRPLPTRAGPAGITICNEAMFPHVVARRVRAGADYLVNLSNDTWIDSPTFVEQQLAIVSLRAVEQRRWLVRASTSGPSAIVDTTGRVIERSPPRSRAVLFGSIRPRSGATLYGLSGDAFAWCCVVLVASLAVRARRKDAS